MRKRTRSDDIAFISVGVGAVTFGVGVANSTWPDARLATISAPATDSHTSIVSAPRPVASTVQPTLGPPPLSPASEPFELLRTERLGQTQASRSAHLLIELADTHTGMIDFQSATQDHMVRLEPLRSPAGLWDRSLPGSGAFAGANSIRYVIRGYRCGAQGPLDHDVIYSTGHVMLTPGNAPDEP